MMKRALLAVAVAMIAITSCGGSGKQVVGTYCRVEQKEYPNWGEWKTIGNVWLVFSDGSTRELIEQSRYVFCFAGVSG